MLRLFFSKEVEITGYSYISETAQFLLKVFGRQKVWIKGEVHTFSILRYVNLLKKLERTKKTAGPKQFFFSHNGPSKLAILSSISDDVTGFKRPFSLYISYIKHWKEVLITCEPYVLKWWKLASWQFDYRKIRKW